MATPGSEHWSTHNVVKMTWDKSDNSDLLNKEYIRRNHYVVILVG